MVYLVNTEHLFIQLKLKELEQLYREIFNTNYLNYSEYSSYLCISEKEHKNLLAKVLTMIDLIIYMVKGGHRFTSEILTNKLKELDTNKVHNVHLGYNSNVDLLITIEETEQKNEMNQNNTINYGKIVSDIYKHKEDIDNYEYEVYVMDFDDFIHFKVKEYLQKIKLLKNNMGKLLEIIC